MLLLAIACQAMLFAQRRHKVVHTHAEIAQALTAGKGSDREKFDAIFYWVARNISYNYSEYYSSASAPVSVDRILASRSAMCLGYATLMDTLCQAAGLTNVTVLGYGKDEIFDVNDSVYMDNHAWNAVRLDGLWYLYDVTWSSGKKEYKLKPVGNFVTSWLENHPESFKKKKVRAKRKLRSDCGQSVASQSFYYKQRVLNELLRKLVARLPVKTGLHYTKGVNTHYYLSDPAVFTVTHIPADPTWMLGAGKGITALETDSAYYYQTDSILAGQPHEGSACAECDRYAEQSESERLRSSLERSAAFNAKNRFIRAYYDFYLAGDDFEKAGSETDSLHKLALVDSAGLYCQISKDNMKACKKNLSVEFNLQKKKNVRKQSVLTGENQQHLLFIKKKVKQTITMQQEFKEMSNKSEAFAHAYNESAVKTHHFRTHLKTDKLSDYPEKKLSEINRRLGEKEVQVDSLILEIGRQRAEFDSLVYNLALNVWPQAFQHDSLIRPFYKGALLRRYQLDNYKKTVVDLRKKLVLAEQDYNNQVNNILYTPASQCTKLFNSVYKLVQAKNALQQECLNDRRELLKAKTLSESDLDAYKSSIIDGKKLDFCWLSVNYPKLYSIHYGFVFLGMKQKQTAGAIAMENATERERKSAVSDELKRRYQKHTYITSANIRLINKNMKALRLYRKALVKK